jgi:SPP1 gp7 family putative phage head morphogenesis protein
MNAALRLKALQDRYKSKTETEFIKALRLALKNITIALADVETLSEARQLKELKKLIEVEINKVYDSLKDPLKEDIGGFAKLAYSQSIKQANSLTKLALPTAIPTALTKEVIKLDNLILMGNKAYSFNDLLGTASAAQINRFKQVVGAGVIQSKGIKAITEDLKKISAVSERDLHTIVHTSLSYAKEFADREAEEQFSDIIIGWQSVAVLDSSTSMICATLDGEQYLKEDGYTREDIPDLPPRHFNCRSVVIPIYETDTKGTRAQNGDKKGQTPAKINFSEWFDSQSDNFQEKYLGAARYNLYKADKLDLKDFVDIKTGKLFTLKEIEDML